MDTTPVPPSLILLTQAEYLRLRHDLKAAGLDLCYAAQAAQPIRLDWTANLFTDAKFLQQLEPLRPADHSYRIVSVQHSKKGGWLRPDEFTITFHAVGQLRETDLEQYLTAHHVQSSATTPKAMLAAAS